MMNTEAKSHNKHPRLFPYINRGKSGIWIDFLPGEVSQGSITDTFPFAILNFSDPMAYLVGARLVTDADSELETLVVLLQRDQVAPEKNKSHPTTNLDIEQYWQRTFSNYSKNGAFDDCLIQLGDQLADNGRLLPFEPLLYCADQKQFFPLPCPLCGGLLDLCRNDKLLVSTGLPPYSNSFRRYLYCPTCHQLAGETDFYACLPSDEDRDHCKGQTELINDLKKLAASTTPTQRLPCRDCTKTIACHAPNGPMSHRITPLAFYPFHMLVFRATSVNLSDFPPLMAQKPGAPPSENDLSDQSVDTTPIADILRKIINQWQTAASKRPVAIASQDLTQNSAQDPIKNQDPVQSPTQNTEKSSLIDSVIRPPQPAPQKPLSNPSTLAPILTENPDFQETMIVSVNRNQPPADGKPLMPSDADIPETMIIGTPRPTTPESVHSSPNLGGRQHPQASIPDPSKPPQPDILPETIIVHSAENSLPGARNPKISPDKASHPSEGQKEVHPNIKFAFNPTSSPEPTDSFRLRNNQGDNPSVPDNKLLKTFVLGPYAKKTDDLVKHRKIPSPNQHKTVNRSKPDAEDNLARTIVVPVKKKGKDKK